MLALRRQRGVNSEVGMGEKQRESHPLSSSLSGERSVCIKLRKREGGDNLELERGIRFLGRKGKGFSWGGGPLALATVSIKIRCEKLRRKRGRLKIGPERFLVRGKRGDCRGLLPLTGSAETDPLLHAPQFRSPSNTRAPAARYGQKSSCEGGGGRSRLVPSAAVWVCLFWPFSSVSISSLICRAHLDLFPSSIPNRQSISAAVLSSTVCGVGKQKDPT